MAFEHVVHRQVRGGVFTRNLTPSKCVVHVDALVVVEHLEFFHDFRRPHHADVDVVEPNHVLGDPLYVFGSHCVESGEIGLVVILGQVVARDVEGKPRHRAWAFQRTSKPTGQRRLRREHFCGVWLRVSNACNLVQEFDHCAVGDFCTHVGICGELPHHWVGPQAGAGPVCESFVFTKILHESSAEYTAT